MSAARVRRWMLGLSALLVVAQLADLVWSRADARAASPASVVFAGALVLLLALYPNGRPVPRWTLAVAGGGVRAVPRGEHSRS